MEFEKELNRVLPSGLPQRDIVLEKAARHLALIVAANQHFNLTRITSPAEAAIKHVLDSVLPWHLFASARDVLDAGSGAGFPGIPLALVLPGTRFTLAESIQKKARFIDSAVSDLELPNVTVEARRAEDLFSKRHFDIIVARALAPLSRAVPLFAPTLNRGSKVLMYKGPDAEQEIADAAGAAARARARMEIALRYELPNSMGARTIVQIVR